MRPRLPGFFFAGALLCAVPLAVAAEPPATGSPFVSKVLPLGEKLSQRMKGKTWRAGCPVPLSDLRHVRVSAVDSSGEDYIGELIVHMDVAEELVAIFREIHAARFPIEKMALIHVYGGDDDQSVAANNTSAFNCRKLTGNKKKWSRHALGRAIDINPLWNPYVKQGKVLPPAGQSHVDRKNHRPGMIQSDDVVHRAFLSRGWRWGGDWRRIKDYQHFDKKK